jgi:hypothetical protein
MSIDPALVPARRISKFRIFRSEGHRSEVPRAASLWWTRLALVALAIGFVIVGATDLDLGPAEGRLGLAAGERVGPLGQVFGYWAPDLWPAEVLPSLLFAQLEPFGRPGSAAVRWPAAIAGIIAGLLLARGMSRTLGLRAGVLVGLSWFGSVALIDRSGAAGLDMILGLATLAAIERLIDRGSDWVAGMWTALAFLAGGWIPIVLVGLAIIVLGKRSAHFSFRLLVPPLLTAAGWSTWTLATSSPDAWAAALTLPLTMKPSWFLVLSVAALGLPWSPFMFLGLAYRVREGWTQGGRTLLLAWLQVSLACLIAGTLIPGFAPACLFVALGGFCVLAAACLEAAWTRPLSGRARRAFFALFSAVIGLWLIVMFYASYVWCLNLPYYRTLGVFMAVLLLCATYLAWSSLELRDCRRGVLTLMVVAAGLKLAHWGYYVPEWNYRYSQGPWARAIAQWVPRRWTLYTFHEWPPDLAFFTKRRVRQLRSPHYLEYETGETSKYVLLLPSEYEHWPESAPPVSLVARFQDQSAEERILARTSGFLPPPFGPNLYRTTHWRGKSSLQAQLEAHP